MSTSSFITQTRNTENYGNRFLGFDIYYPLLARASDVFTQELRLASIGEEPVQWTLGAFYRDAQLDADTTFHFGAPIPPGSPLPLPPRSLETWTSPSTGWWAPTR